MRGVRAQLAGLVAATTSVVLLAFLVPLGLLLRSEAEKRAISDATLQAQSLAALVAVNPLGATERPGAPSSTRDDGPIISVFLPDGQVSGTATDSTPAVELARRGRAFAAEYRGGIEILVPVQGMPDGTAVVRAYVPPDLRYRGAARTWAALALLGLALFGLGLLVADRLGRRLVGSVTALAGTADQLSRGDLTARVAPAGPRELRRVGEQLNRLAGRIGDLLTAEREEVADLAHRLRTPITALRLDAESLRDGEEQARLASDVDSMARAVDEVIRTARRPVREGAGAWADLGAVAAERVDFWTALAEDTGRPLTLTLPAAPIPVRASSGDLAAVLDALLENVFAHTPDGTAARVEVAATPAGGGRLVIDDAGRGFQEAGVESERGNSGGGSTGLGLDIARRTALASGGTFAIGTSPSLGGARIELNLGPPHQLPT